MDLTKAECLYIKRRREGITQATAAERYGVTRKQYIAWELGQTQPAVVGLRKPTLQPHEECVLRRRRDGLTQGDVAAHLQRSRNWVRMMEQGTVPCAELKEFWCRG